MCPCSSECEIENICRNEDCNAPRLYIAIAILDCDMVPTPAPPHPIHPLSTVPHNSGAKAEQSPYQSSDKSSRPIVLTSPTS